MTKAKKITTITISCICAVLAIFVTFWYFGDTYTQFYAKANKEFAIAGLNEGFTPQGICYDSTTETFLTCGYMKNGSESRIYVYDTESKTTTKYVTLTNNAEKYVGHAGGIATDGTNVWIVGDGTVLRISFQNVLDTENKNAIDVLDSFETNNGADFVTVENGNLWVGEFQRDGKYDKNESHFVETSDSTNKAISFCYTINSSKAYGIESTIPTKALSTTSLVQGMVVSNDKIVLSTSYSLANSHIYSYNNVLNAETTKTFAYNEENNIPLYILDSQNLIEDLKTPCMSEEIVEADGRIFVLFESACQKYNLFTREQLRNVYSIDL